MGFKFFEKNRLVTGGALCCCLIMVLLPEVTARASKEAISLWLNSIAPVLFPFFIAANFLKSTGLVNRISPRIYPFAMGVLSGYPMGAKIAGDYYQRGCIDKDQLRRILSCSMVTGPAFLIGAVGHEFLGSRRLGLILLVSHYISAILNSFFYGRNTGQRITGRTQTAQKDSYYNIFTDAILESFRSIGIILAYIIIFMIAADLLQFSGILRFLDPEEAAFVKGLLEMTVGCSSLAMCPQTEIVRVTLAAFMVTFGGFSVIGQTMSMLRGCSIKCREILQMKLLHGLLCAIITFSIASFVV